MYLAVYIVSDAAFMAEMPVDPDRHLYRAMDQLERLQRQRRGETVPPPLNIIWEEGDSLFANKAKKCFIGSIDTA